MLFAWQLSPCKFSYTNFFVTFLFAVIQSFFFFSFFDFLWNSYICTTTGNKIILERLVTSSSLFLHNWGTKIIGIRPYVSKWCPNIKRIKAQKIYIVWSLLILLSISYEKNMHCNKNEDFFSIIDSCSNSGSNIDLITSSYVSWNGGKQNTQFFRKNAP